MLLVTGATGHAGSQVVRALRERGRPVRAFVRDPDRARGLLGDEVEFAVGDFADPASLSAALEGVEGLLLSGADDPRRVAWETRAIDLAVASGVRRIVRVSVIGARRDSGVALWDWHGRIDDHLLESAVSTAILRCNAFMSNLLAGAEGIARDGRLYAPAGEARIGMIDPRDIGAAAAAVLTGAGHDGQTYVLTGPEAITYAQAAAALSAATGHPVEFVDVSEDLAAAGMIAAGLPEEAAGRVVEVFAALRAGAGDRVTDAVASLTGRSARDVASFARDHAQVFAPVAGVAR